jgi:hypothetical protein
VSRNSDNGNEIDSTVPRLVAVCLLFLGPPLVLTEKQIRCNFCYDYGSRFHDSNHDLFTCDVINQRIDSVGFTIAPSSGSLVESLKIFDESQVAFLPEKVAEVFPKLVVYRVRSYAIRSINRNNFKGLFDLVDMHLYESGIEVIEPGSFQDNTKLVWLGLDSNKLSYIDEGMFQSLERLETLKLHSNKIKSIDSRAFEGLIKLKSLDLHSNVFEALDHEIFSCLVNLAVINLSFNRLEKLEKDLFKTNENLQRIDLNTNRIKSISYVTFGGLKDLKILDLDYNSCVSTTFYGWNPSEMKNVLDKRCLIDENDEILNEISIENRELERENKNDQEVVEEPQANEDESNETIVLVGLFVVLLVAVFAFIKWKSMKIAMKALKNERFQLV